MMTTNLFVIANVKQLRTGGSFIILLPFLRTSWGVGFQNSAIFNSFNNRVEFCTILEGLRNWGGGVEHPNPPSVRHWHRLMWWLRKYRLEAVVVYLRCCPVICPKELKRTTKTARIGSLAAQNWIRYFSNAQRKRYTQNHARGLAAVVPRWCHADMLSKSCLSSDDETTDQ
jgi:hypothetical protein